MTVPLTGGVDVRFIDAKQKKERGHSVRELTEELNATADEYETVIIVAMKPDKSLDVAFSSDNDSDLIGHLEIAKSILVENIRERE
jgi:DNA-directed RNA polymerase sigma subunit (sigma70/sigma32)